MKVLLQTKWLMPLLLSLLVCITSGCNDDEGFETFEGYETFKLPEWNSEWDVFINYPNVKRSTYENRKGWIIKSGLDVPKWEYGIALDQNQTITGLIPINIYQEQLKSLEGAEIIFSAEIWGHGSADEIPTSILIKNMQVKNKLQSDNQ